MRNRPHGHTMLGSHGDSFSWWDVPWMSPLWGLLLALERISSLHPLSIIARKRLDISFLDIGRACILSLMGMVRRKKANETVREESRREVSRVWSSSLSGPRCFTRSAPKQAPNSVSSNEASTAATPGATAVLPAVAPFLSVRTAFDLYLKALSLPHGSVVICSAMTIPDMVTIFEAHGLVPVPVDIDPETLAPEPGSLELEVQKCNNNLGGGGDALGDGEEQRRRRVRAIYVAHVFGAQVDMAPIAVVAARHGLLLWEDCAQVFAGVQGYLGHPESDATFFSFGVIKRATALGGGVACIRDTAVLADMLQEEAKYPLQSAATYLLRVLKYSLLLAFSTPLLYGIIIHTLGLLGIEHDEVVMKLSKGFPKKGLLKAIRHQASSPLLQMLAWRIPRYSSDGCEIRLMHCNRMLSILDTALVPTEEAPLFDQGQGATTEGCLTTRGGGWGEDIGDVLPGIRAHRHTLWLYPVIVNGGPGRPESVVEMLLREGFDATRAPTSLMPIDRCTSAESEALHQSGASSPPSSSLTPRCSAMMDSLVYLPLAKNIPDSEVDRMALTLARALMSSSTFDCKSGEAREGHLKRRSRIKERRAAAAWSLLSFAYRLDVILISAVCLVVYVLQSMML